MFRGIASHPAFDAAYGDAPANVQDTVEHVLLMLADNAEKDYCEGVRMYDAVSRRGRRFRVAACNNVYVLYRIDTERPVVLVLNCYWVAE